jgi:hypothetical protein
MNDKLPTVSNPFPSPLSPVGSRSLPLSNKRLALALAIAAVADVVDLFVTLTPMVWGVDLVTAILLFMVLGWNWLLLPGIIMEAIPGVSVMPLWTLVVAAIAIWGTARPKLQH